jgi:hypothetical protein
VGGENHPVQAIFTKPENTNPKNIMNDDTDENGSLNEYFEEIKENHGSAFTEKQWGILEEIVGGIYDDIIEKIDNLDTAIIDLNSQISKLE